MAERQFGPYRLVRQIAVGGMAEIHLAKTKGIAGFEKYVALKMIHPNFAEDDQFIQMLVDEAKIAVQLTHGNIAQTFDLGRVGETYYITMEFVDGADLYKVLRRASELDQDIPLDVCAFVGKEVASALDYAHRKRDHSGKPLGIVHRDVSPQNVLLSHAGEVKLVDFGIAKATMKARQTAVGVIKGKYYYMSPEQAWGDPLDHRSDIFSSGIVLYEMITGQMLYLEEDLHKLLDMARKADIAPPSRLRKGVPPQLERIIMHALAKKPEDRYQHASDMASDLERFLHTYSPVFTASKVSGILRQVLGEPQAEPDYVVEMRGGPNATMTLDAELVAHDKEEIRDENSMIFNISDLKPEPVKPAPAPKKPVAPVQPPRAGAISTVDRNPRPPIPGPPGGSRATKTMPPPVGPSGPPRISPQAKTSPAAVAPAPVPAPRPPAKPRQADEETRELGQAPAPRADLWAGAGGPTETLDGDEDLENIGERTMITAAPSADPGLGGGFMGDADDGGGEDDLENIGERTMITAMPTDPATATNLTAAGSPNTDDDDTGVGTEAAPTSADSGDGFDEGPTIARRDAAPPVKKVARRPAGPPPPALAAKIQTPAVSELRKPRASRKTPPGGMPAQQPNVLQAIVNRAGSEPMPAPPRPPMASANTATMTAPPVPALSAASATMNVVLPDHRPTAPDLGFQSELNGIPAGPLSQSMPAAGPLSQSMYAYQEPGGDPRMAQHAQQQPYGGYAPMPPTQPQMAGHMQPPMQQPMQPHMQQPMQPPMQPPMQQMPPQPYGLQTPPPGYPMQPVPGVPAHLQPYLHMQGMPPTAINPYGQPQGYPPGGYPPGMQGLPPHLAQQMSPVQMYPFQGQGYGTAAPLGPTFSGQMRAMVEMDEIPSVYKLNRGPRWGVLAIAGIFAISAAAAATYFIIRSTREPVPTTATVRVQSIPAGATVYFDGQALADKTPLQVDGVPIGTRHEIKLELAKYKPHVEQVDLPKDGRELPVVAQLDPVLGQVDVDSAPEGADVYVNGHLAGHTPMNIKDVDMDATKSVELRLKSYQPATRTLEWNNEGKAAVLIKLQH
jgi:serine/threonine protein kinase